MTDHKTPEQLKHEQAQKQEQGKQAAEHAKQSASKQKHGAISTYGSTEKNDPRGDTFLKHDEIKQLAGDIEPGELAHLHLDEEGRPQGTIFRGIPKPDEVSAVVFSSPRSQFDDLVTPSGAPITKFMNPEPVLYDAGMTARNPPPEQPGDKPSGPIGGGVINQPVTV
jgi:hypothetical protein